MNPPLRVLLVEDSESDAAMVLRQLEKHGETLRWHRVDTAGDLSSALAGEAWDVVICDYQMPQFDAPAALAVLQRTGLDIPFIVVSGTIGEDVAVAMMRAGAQDYLTKGHLGRLAPAVERELADARSRRARREAEAALKLQAAALNAAANGILIMDLGGRILWVNPAFTQLSGYDENEALGKNIRLFYSDEHPPRFYEELWETILAGRVWSGQMRKRRRDGTSYDEEMSITPFRDERGELSHFVAIKQDITERSQTKKRLRDSESRYRMMFDNNPLPMWVFDRETLGILAVNHAAIGHYGWSREEFLAMTMKEIRPEEEIPALLEKTAQTGAARDAARVWRHSRKNGDTIEVEITTHAMTFDGRPAEVVLANDITERQRAERELLAMHRHEEKMANEWRITFDTLDIPVMLIGGDGTILRMNRAACELTGGGFRENIGHSLPQLSGIFPWVRSLALIKQAADLKRPAAAQLRDSASGRIWDCSANWFRYPGSLETSVVFTAREITALVKLQETLRRGETMSAMGSIVSGVAHEVRNPLFGIVATLDAFTANHGDKPEFREYIDILRGETHRLSMLMEDLLDYGRPPSLAITRGPAAGLFAGALEAVQPLALQQGVRIEMRLAPDLPELEFDPQRMRQVFFNLLDNALRHSPPGSAVTLRAEYGADRHSLLCSVLDEGPGIKPEDRPRLFEPFFTRRPGGTGLGLAIVQRIVEQHGGQLTAANRPEGGAVFTVTLPLAGPEN